MSSESHFNESGSSPPSRQVRYPTAGKSRLDIERDQYLHLHGLAVYSSPSVRFLRSRLKDPVRPIPCPGVRADILVSRSKFNLRMDAYQLGPGGDDAALAEISKSAPAQSTTPRARGVSAVVAKSRAGHLEGARAALRGDQRTFRTMSVTDPTVQTKSASRQLLAPHQDQLRMAGPSSSSRSRAPP
jgi:hypothetical protein